MDVVMDPFTFGLLSLVPPPGFGAPADLQIAELDCYLREIGALPPLSVDVSTTPAAAAAYGGSLTLRAPVQLPASSELHDAHVKAAADALPQVSDAASGCKNSATTRTRPQLCAPYDADIEASLRAMERDPTERPSPVYLETTQGGQMDELTRAFLVTLMSSFARDNQLAPAAIYRAVSYVDRFLSVRAVPTIAHLCHLGTVSVFLAAKYEDQSTLRRLNAMGVARHCELTTGMEVLAVEGDIVKALDYKLGGPTAYTFLEHFIRYNTGADEQDLQVQQVAHHLVEQSLLQYSSLGYLPSAVAASAIFLAKLQIMSPPLPEYVAQPWSKDLVELTGYEAIDLMDSVCCMYPLIATPSFLLLKVHFGLESIE